MYTVTFICLYIYIMCTGGITKISPALMKTVMISGWARNRDGEVVVTSLRLCGSRVFLTGDKNE